MIISFNFPLLTYKKYSRNIDGYLPLSFLFCFNSEEMQKKYYLTESKSKKQIKLQIFFLRITNFQKYYFLITFSIFIGIHKYFFNKR